jgi:hypothetical protein
MESQLIIKYSIGMQVVFKLNQANTKMGENLYIVGNNAILGNWKVSTLVMHNYKHLCS